MGTGESVAPAGHPGGPSGVGASPRPGPPVTAPDTPRRHVTAVIVSHNSGHVIGGCLEQLLGAGEDPHGPRVRIVLVDNASTDDTIALAVSLSEDIHIIRNRTNLGFARAVNIGCRDVGDDAVLLINPDAILETGALPALLEELAHDPGLAACAPVTFDPRTFTRYLPAGRLPRLWPMACYASGLARIADRTPVFRGHYFTLQDALGGATEVEWASAGCLLIRTSVWRDVGGFSERWFMYGEDVDLSFRMRKAGHRIRIVAAAEVVHSSGTGSRGHDGQVSASWLTNLADFYARSLAPNPAARIAWRLLMGTAFLLRATVLHIRPNRSTAQQRQHDLYRYHRYARAMFRGEPPSLNPHVDPPTGGERPAPQPQRTSGRARSVSLSLVDQTTYGLSTYLVTAMAARTSDPASLGRFMTIWVTSWLVLSLLSAAVLIPLRIALARGQLHGTEVHGLQRLAFTAGTGVTALAVGAGLLAGPALAHVTGGLAVATVGFAYALTRGLGYNDGQEGRIALRSTGNLLLTLPLLGTVLLLHGSVTRWGLAVAAVALLPSAVPAPGPRIPWRKCLHLLAVSKRESLWNAVSAAVSGGVFGAGLMWLVTVTRGEVETGHLAQVLVLVTPVQLASATLPLLSLHRLAAAVAERRAFAREWLQELHVYALLSAAGFGVLYLVYEPWTQLILGDMNGVPWLAATGCGLGILFGSWAGTAVRASQSARNLLIGPMVAAVAVIVGERLGLPTMYLLTLVYAIAASAHALMVLGWLRGGTRGAGSVRLPVAAVRSGAEEPS